MRLEPGQAAVPFTVQTLEGKTVSLAHFAGAPLMLMFLRYASCPMCNLRLHDLAENYPRLREQGLTVLAFFHSSAPRIRAHAGRRHYPFVLVADPELRCYRDYGVETSWPRLLLSMARPGFLVAWLRSLRHRFWGGVAWQMAKMPAEFLIGPDGRIVVAHYGRDIGDHLPIARIETFLDELHRSATAGSSASAAVNSVSNSASPTPSFSRVVTWSLLWALSLVASSFLLKGFAVGEWVDSILYLTAAVGVSAYVLRHPTRRCA